MKITFTFLISLLVSYIHAQQTPINFYKLTNEDGLSQTTVNVLFKDSEGFLWIGTDDGLNRYDGKQVKKYYYRYTDTTTIAANEVYGICEDKSGRLWFAHYNAGLSCLNKKTGRFCRVQKTGIKNKTLSSDRIFGLYCDKDGFIWARSINGISKINPKNFLVQNFHGPSFTEITNIVTNTDLVEMQEYILFGSKTAGLLKIRKDGKIVPFREWDKKLYGLQVSGIYKDSDRELFVVSEKGLFKIYTENNKSIVQPIVLDSVAFATASKITRFENTGQFWIGTNAQGILIVDVNQKKIVRRLTSQTISDNLISNAILYFVQDDEKNLFVGTGRGVNIYSPYSRLFNNYENAFKKIVNFGHPVYAIYELSDGNLLIGTKYRAAYYFNTTTYQATQIPLPNNNAAVPKNTIYHFTPYKVNKFFVCTSNGLYKLTVEKDTCIISAFQYFPELKSVDSLPITDVFIYNDSLAYIASSTEGLFKWNYKSHTIRQYKKDETSSYRGPVDNQLMKIVPTVEKDLVLCTKFGFSIFYPSVDTFLNLAPGKNYPYELPARNVKYAYDDGKFIWVTTYGAGVQKFDKVKHTFTGITTKDGLPNDAVYAVIPDDNGKIWISTNNGLAAYHIQTKAIQTFTTQDGLPENEFNGYSAYRSNSGKIFYSTLNGVISINRRIDVSNPYSPNIVITHFEANYKKNTTIFNCYSKSAIELPHGFNSINIRFAALSFAAPSKNLYKVKLAGYDNDWINLYDDNEVRYTGLPPGNYVFNVMASNNSGKWSNKVLSLKINVLPFWYQTNWFKVLVVLAVLALIYGLYTYRVRELLRVERMRQRISSDLHDDIGSTLSSINIYSKLAREEKDNIPYIDTIQQYTQNIIGNLDDLVWSINPKNDSITITALADRMRSFAEPILAAKGIRCRFIEDIDNSASLTLEQRNNLFLAYKEMVNNMLKHSNCRNCTIHFTRKGKLISIAVDDDGEGFSMQKVNGKRNGLKNLDYRAKQLHGKFILESEDGKGTRAKLLLRI